MSHNTANCKFKKKSTMSQDKNKTQYIKQS